MQQLLYILPALMCPLGMGAMMWLMMRGGKQQPTTPALRERELADLRAEIDQLRSTQHPSTTAPEDAPLTLDKLAKPAQAVR
jgi:hypothetical protein